MRVGAAILATCFAAVLAGLALAIPGRLAAADAPDSARTRPTLFIIGDSTVHNPQTNRAGWGDVIGRWFDASAVTVTNLARGGRSSRTYITEGLWDPVRERLKPGDVVMIQFGHNDGGPLDTGRARASLKGAGDETSVITNQVTGRIETVHTYGWYLRQYCAETKAKGATPIVLSPIPRNIWKDGKLVRAAETYGRWAAESAQAAGALFIDLNAIVAGRYDELGEAEVKRMFPFDHTHTDREGAGLNAACVVAGLRELKGCPLAKHVLSSPAPLPAAGGSDATSAAARTPAR